MSLQHYKSQLNDVSRHLIGNSVPPNNILIPFSLSSAQKKIGYHYWLLMQGGLLTKEGLKHSLDPAQWSNTLAQKLNSNIEFIGFSIGVVILKDKNIDNEKKKYGKKHNGCLVCSTGSFIIQKLDILWLLDGSVLPRKKKHFSFSSSLIVPNTIFPSRSFHSETQKVFYLNAALSQRYIRGPV